MPQTFCLVCGSGRDEVERMHNFPANPQRSKIWQDKMGIIYVPGRSLKNYIICCRHFTPDNYLDISTGKLRRDAAPTLLPCRRQLKCEEMYDMQSKVVVAASKIEDQPLTIEPTPGTSGVQYVHSAFKFEDASPPLPLTPTTRRASVFRGITQMDATPRKSKLMKMVLNKESHIRKLKVVCRKRAGDIKALSDFADSTVVRNLFSGMSGTTTDFLISQLRCAKRTPKGRRWTIKEKVMALALLKRSPRCYNFLRKIVAMPSKKALITLLHKVPFYSGINSHIFKHIGQSLKTDEDRICVLIFDEMDIKEHLEYNQHDDRICGFEELGNRVSSKWANRALVFMLQGLARKWKQPVAYFFSSNGCPSDILKECLLNVIDAAQNYAGVQIVGTICDMGSTNVKTLKLLGSSVEHPYFEHNEKNIFTIYDPPHLLKCTASLFRKHNVELPVPIAGQDQLMQARFGDIIKAYQIDKNSPLVFRAMYKLKETHLAPIMQYAMKVCIAAQVMSHTVSAFLYTLLTRGELEQRAVATATFVQQVDELFDSFNGTQVVPADGKELKCCISENSAHISYWTKAFNLVKRWTFLRVKKGGDMRSKPPSQIGWLTSIRAVSALWRYLHMCNFQYLRTRTLNQDGLENLFGAIRGGCGSGDNPTTIQFSASLKTQVLNGLTKHAVSGTNCEIDEHDLLTDLKDFVNVEDADEETTTSSVTNVMQEPADVVANDISEAVSTGDIATLSVAYVSRFIAKRLFAELQCNNCSNILLSTSLDPHNLFIAYKEWSDQDQLQYPSETLVIAIGQSITVLEAKLNSSAAEANIGQLLCVEIKELLSLMVLSCPLHTAVVVDSISKAICKI